MKQLCLMSLILISFKLFAFNDNKMKSIEQNISNGDTLKLKITVGESVLTATMYDNPTSKDFVSLLPLTLTLTDYNNTEKICDLPRKLSTKDAPAGYTPSAGDLTIYAPWGNLALFYKDFSYSTGLIVLGKLDNGIDEFNVSGPVMVKVERL